MSLAEYSELRAEIAEQAARLIAQEGLEIREGLQKALKQLAFKAPPQAIPEDLAIESALLEYLEEVEGDTAPQALRELRLLAIDYLTRLENLGLDGYFYVAGGVWLGWANHLSVVHLHAYLEDSKNLEIALLDAGVAYETAPRQSEGGTREAFIFYENDIPIILTVLPLSLHAKAAQKRADGSCYRASSKQLQTLMAGLV